MLHATSYFHGSMTVAAINPSAVFSGPPLALLGRFQFSPSLGNGIVYRENPIFKPVAHLGIKPVLQTGALLTRFPQGAAFANFSQRDDADVNLVLAHGMEPFQNARLRAWAGQLRRNIGIE